MTTVIAVMQKVPFCESECPPNRAIILRSRTMENKLKETTKMKHAKKLSALLLALILMLSFAACGSEQKSAGQCTIVVGGQEEKVYSVPLNALSVDKGLISVLDYLKENEGLDVEYTESATGAFLTKVGECEQDEKSGVYVYIYTSVEKDFDVSEYKKTMDYKGTALTSSGVGASQMTVCDGAIVYIGTIKY